MNNYRQRHEMQHVVLDGKLLLPGYKSLEVHEPFRLQFHNGRSDNVEKFDNDATMIFLRYGLSRYLNTAEFPGLSWERLPTPSVGFQST